MATRVNGLGDAYNRAQAEFRRARLSAVNARAALIAGNVSANAVISIMSGVKSSIELWQAVGALPGLGAYAQEQENDPTYDAVAEYQLTRDAAILVRDECITRLGGAGNVIQKDTVNADGSISVLQITPAQTVDIQVALQGLVDTIEEL